MLETKRQRIWFTFAAIWFCTWTLAYIGSAFTPAGFKLGGWFMFAVFPIALVWGVVAGVGAIRRWIGQGQ